MLRIEKVSRGRPVPDPGWDARFALTPTVVAESDDGTTELKVWLRSYQRRRINDQVVELAPLPHVVGFKPIQIRWGIYDDM